jgi:hypothetical protein
VPIKLGSWPPLVHPCRTDGVIERGSGQSFGMSVAREVSLYGTTVDPRPWPRGVIVGWPLWLTWTSPGSCAQIATPGIDWSVGLCSPEILCYCRTAPRRGPASPSPLIPVRLSPLGSASSYSLFAPIGAWVGATEADRPACQQWSRRSRVLCCRVHSVGK